MLNIPRILDFQFSSLAVPAPADSGKSRSEENEGKIDRFFFPYVTMLESVYHDAQHGVLMQLTQWGNLNKNTLITIHKYF